MRRAILLFAALIHTFCSHAQHSIPLRNLWADPTVHVLFEGYVVSFTIKDINHALQLLAETGDSTWGSTSGLDTAKQYTVELFPGYNTEYRDRLQPLLQKGIGAYLLSVGHAEVENSRHHLLRNVVIDVQPGDEEGLLSDVKFYDDKSGSLIFNGILPVSMYNKDIGIE